MPFAAEPVSQDRHVRTITAAECHQYLGIPLGTITGWASAARSHIRANPDSTTGPPRALFAYAIDEHGRALYDLEDVLRLMWTTKRRARQPYVADES